MLNENLSSVGPITTQEEKKKTFILLATKTRVQNTSCGPGFGSFHAICYFSAGLLHAMEQSFVAAQYTFSPL